MITVKRVEHASIEDKSELNVIEGTHKTTRQGPYAALVTPNWPDRKQKSIYTSSFRGSNPRVFFLHRELFSESDDVPKPLLVAFAATSVETTAYPPHASGGTLAWYFRGEIYATKADDRLTPEDVRALIMEAENKRRVRLEKAHAVAAMAEALKQPRRAPVPQDVRIVVWKRDGGRCVDCDSRERLEFDHIIPVSMGGANTERNLQLLCEACNRRKGASLG